jgi:hypothetical protein
MAITADKVQYWIDNCLELNDNWLSGFLQIAIGNDSKLHWWPMEFNNFAPGDVVVFYDEYIKLLMADIKSLEKLKQSVVITSNQTIYNQLTGIGILVIYFPYIHWFVNLITIRKLNLKIPRLATTKIFNFLNRRWNPGRFHLVEYICKTYPNLIDQGYITANTFSYYENHPGFYKDQEFVKWYVPEYAPIELNNHKIDDISVGVNIKNLLHISKTIPGVISIQVETWPQEEDDISFLTEKSMVALATQQIPIIIGSHDNWMKLYIKDQGFDTFDDIIDHSYDLELDYFLRIKQCIDLNYDILSGKRSLPDIGNRLEKNQNYLFNEWADQTLINLLNQIYKMLNRST